MKTQKLQSLQSLKVPELQKKAKALGAKDISGMRKQELIKLIYELQAKNKEKIYARKSEKIVCECGAIVSRRSISCHKKRKIHLTKMNLNNGCGEERSDQSQ